MQGQKNVAPGGVHIPGDGCDGSVDRCLGNCLLFLHRKHDVNVGSRGRLGDATRCARATVTAVRNPSCGRNILRRSQNLDKRHSAPQEQSERQDTTKRIKSEEGNGK